MNNYTVLLKVKYFLEITIIYHVAFQIPENPPLPTTFLLAPVVKNKVTK
jgi:hypothetical protein